LRGEALDRVDRTAEAFDAVRRGKALQRALHAERAAGREGEPAKCRRLASWFSLADPAAWRSDGRAEASSSAAGHAFLVGFPRSGTTLLEQALAGHPEVVALEEAPTLAEPYAEFMTSADGLERLAALSEAEIARWRARYWAVVAAHDVDPADRLFLDKAPAGTVYLPLIAKLFPGARVLFAVRDPRDVTLSCFRGNFGMNAMTFAFTDLQETADCYDACMGMAEVYRRVLPLDLLDVRHEALVDDLQGGLAAVCAFLGLEPTDRTADFAATASSRAVRTPSADQVREGLSRRGLARWRLYEDELGPVLPVLAPWVARFGYPLA
jgi:catechol 2,3-dioxygenase-like lactoylglutathione lyase family enzyme